MKRKLQTKAGKGKDASPTPAEETVGKKGIAQQGAYIANKRREFACTASSKSAMVCFGVSIGLGGGWVVFPSSDTRQLRQSFSRVPRGNLSRRQDAATPQPHCYDHQSL